MITITDPNEIARYRALASNMMEDRIQFKTNWLRQKGWKVVPVESGMHFTEGDLSAIVSALRQAGSQQCFALASEDLNPLPSCYELSVDEEDFQEFNKTCGLFWFLIADDNLSWAISCNNTYNLFAASPALLEGILHKSIPAAREEFAAFARELAHENTDYPPLRVAERYARI
jgi:hypothetical protein